METNSIILESWYTSRLYEDIIHSLYNNLGLNNININITNENTNDQTVAGKYPTLSVDDVFYPAENPAVPAGSWVYDFSDGEDAKLGTVAIPGSELVSEAVDPVVLVAKNTDLNIALDGVRYTL